MRINAAFFRRNAQSNAFPGNLLFKQRLLGQQCLYFILKHNTFIKSIFFYFHKNKQPNPPFKPLQTKSYLLLRQKPSFLASPYTPHKNKVKQNKVGNRKTKCPNKLPNNKNAIHCRPKPFEHMRQRHPKGNLLKSRRQHTQRIKNRRDWVKKKWQTPGKDRNPRTKLKDKSRNQNPKSPAKDKQRNCKKSKSKTTHMKDVECIHQRS